MSDWQSNGLGQPQCSRWVTMDEPVAPWMMDAGADGWIEFREEPDGKVTGIRFWRPFNWSLG